MGLPKSLALKIVRTKFALLSTISKRKAAEEAFELFCTPQLRIRKPLPPVFKKAEELKIEFKGYILRGFRWNSGFEKKAVILHGFESSIVNFDRYVTGLLEKDYEVLGFDAPAHGESSGKTLNAVVYKKLVQYIWNYFGPIDSFVTHSFGGLALCLALEDIHHSSSTKIVLIAPASETKTAVDNFFKYLKLGEGVRKEFDMVIGEQGGRSTEWYSIARVAPSIKGQVLFLQDKDDHLTPLSDVKTIMDQHYPNFRFIISEGLGHRKIYRDEASINTILQFL